MEHHSTMINNELLIHAITCMNHEHIMLSKISQSKISHMILFHSYEISRIGKSIETEGRLVVT